MAVNCCVPLLLLPFLQHVARRSYTPIGGSFRECFNWTEVDGREGCDLDQGFQNGVFGVFGDDWGNVPIS